MLLPRPVEEDDEEDPRAELVRRLQEYERFKGAAQDLDRIPRLERDLFETQVHPPDLETPKPLPDIALKELIGAFRDVVSRAELYSNHNIARESLSVRERMSTVLSALRDREFTEFAALCGSGEGRLGVVVTLLAVLELIKESLVEVVQSGPFAPLYLKAAAGPGEA
jgi:segregation and condensation protein A